MNTITPKSWESFQHYKDRKPAWIKLHRDLLDNYDFHCLPIASRALAPCLWLLASEYEGGAIPADWSLIAFRLRMTVEEVNAAVMPLIEKGFFIASNPLADGKRGACLEKEKEKETEKEKEKETEKETEKDIRATRSQSVSAQTLIDQHAVDPQVAADFLALRKAKRAPLTQTALDGLLAGFTAAGLTVDAGLRICISKNWQGFDPSWLTGGNHGSNQSGRPLSAVGRVRAAAERAGFGDQPTGRTFDAQ